jgi:ketosteroid isomerase-like protein
MSQEDVEAVRGIYDRWGDGDFQAGVDLFAEYVLMVVGPGFAASGPYLGAEAIGRYVRDELLRTWADFTIKAERIRPAGDSVLVSVRQSGVGRGSGVATDAPYFMLWTFRGGKVVRFENFAEEAEALEAAGLRE